jgi:Calcineurin-like phosphoesterase
VAGHDRLRRGEPARPTDMSRQQLGFTPAKRVKWLAPATLYATGSVMSFASKVGRDNDKREYFHFLDDPNAALTDVLPGVGDSQDIWFDYAADSGDGFDATYSMATLLAQPSLTLRDPQDCPELPRGRVLVLGGDQVYPYASKDTYNDRFQGPFRAALPYVEDEDKAPFMLALPGNHDWYDGLTTFLRIFAHGSWVGGWRTAQKRSYFAVRLSPRWVLLALDSQFDTYIDKPQIDYFTNALGHVGPHDGLIICTARPVWVLGNLEGREEEYSPIDYFIRKVLRERKSQVRLWLSGDEHHYARYENDDDDPTHYITSGGAGAFLSPTHHLPEVLSLPPARSIDPGKSRPPTTADFQTSFPTTQQSRRLRRQFWKIPFRNPSLIPLVAVIYLLTTWPMLAHWKAQSVWSHWQRAFHSPTYWIFSATFFLGSATLAKVRGRKRLLVVAQGVGHMVASVGSVFAAAALIRLVFHNHSTLLRVIATGLIGGVAGVAVLSMYFAIADRFGVSSDHFFSGLGHDGYKGFLRMHIVGDKLTVYPIGLSKPGREWKLAAGVGSPGDRHRPWLEPKDPLEIHLIESPIVIRSPRFRPEPDGDD